MRSQLVPELPWTAPGRPLRVADGLTTTFAGTYTRVVSLAEALLPGSLATYAEQATGEKFLIAPNLE